MGRHSYWHHTSERPSFAGSVNGALRDTTFDVTVVGAGIAGVMTAYQLARDGARVAVLEMDSVGAGQTGHTTAHMTWLLDAPPYDVQRAAGSSAFLLYTAHASAIDEVERIATREGIECELAHVDAYVLGLASEDAEELRRTVEAYRRLELACTYLEAEDVPIRAPGGAIRARGQAKLHPLKFLYGLARVASEAGATFLEHARVTDASHGHGVWTVRAGSREVRSKSLVVATHSPFGRVPQLQTRLSPYQTYAVALRIPKGAVPEACYFDTAQPYGYTRIEERHDHGVAIVGGRDHRTGKVAEGERPFEELADYFRRRFDVPGAEMTHRWSGQVLEPADGIAFIGRYPGWKPDRYVATGFSGNGITYGVMAGVVLKDLIRNREHPLAGVLDPGRINLAASAEEVVKHNAEVSHDFIFGHLSRGERTDIEQVPLEQGTILSLQGRKRAVYRDKDGAVTVLSPSCPHMGCTVSWNPVDAAWGCSCHGSRFSATGDVFTGPAVSGLRKLYGGEE